MLVHDPSIAASLRDVFLGVKELGLVQNVVRNAERAGREAYLRDVDLALREKHEVRRARALAAFGKPNVSPDIASSPPEEGGEATPGEGEVRPATLREGELPAEPKKVSTEKDGADGSDESP
jgi:hypothetical protein